MGEFYGMNLFLAESSATTGGLDSLLEPTGNIKVAQDNAARAFGADHVFFVTNGTSTSNKMVEQALLAPGDIMLVDRNCHKSHHYGAVLTGALPLYVEAYPLTQYSMYGAVPLRSIKKALLDLKAEGKLDRARMLVLTNCTFDGHIYNVERVMEECLAIKPDLIFLWDEAWFGFARWSPFYRRRTAMGAAAILEEKFADPAYRTAYQEQAKKLGEDLDPGDKRIFETRLLANPDKVRTACVSDQLDPQVHVVPAPGIDGAGSGPGLSHRGRAVPRSGVYSRVDLAESSDHRFHRCGAPPDGVRRL